MPEGHPDYTQKGTGGGGQTVAVSHRPKVAELNLNQTSSLSAGSSESTEVYAPTDSLYSVFLAHLYAASDADATSGDHQFDIKPIGGVSTIRGTSTYNTNIKFAQSHWKTVDESYPPNAAAALQAVQALKASPDKPVTILYQNNTDAMQENTRFVKLYVTEETY